MMEIAIATGSNRPYAAAPGKAPPSFVGDHYYCKSGNTGGYDLSEPTDFMILCPILLEMLGISTTIVTSYS